MKKTFFFTSESDIPYHNIALETFMLENLPADTGIFYLWRNKRTVVIGRNQNAWKECRAAELEADGGRLARRLSGGGAVFHDLGNLCFTFFFPNSVYDIPRQTACLLEALKSLNFDAAIKGRNDIEIDGKKFSGHAYYRGKAAALHHGTFLVNADLSLAQKYLSPPALKIVSKGVESVRSRIVNLAEINPGLTIEKLSAALLKSFEREYGGGTEELNANFFDAGRLAELEKHFSSNEWIYGKSPKSQIEAAWRFEWGVAEVCFDVIDGKIAASRVYSDAMDEARIEKMPAFLDGSRFVSEDELAKRVDAVYNEK